MSKVILITGASSGLGEQIATYLAGKGYQVYGTSRSIESQTKPFKTLNMDVCDSTSIQNALERVLKESGRLDVLINNAGLGIAAPLEYLPIDEFQRVMDTNLMGSLRTIQAVLPTMRKQQKGYIINISSIAAEAGLPFRGGYSASKSALDRLTETLRLELTTYGIQVCSIQPGGVKTDINKNRVKAKLADDNIYKQDFDRTYQMIDESVDQGISADVFGPLVGSIIESSSVKRIYRVGKPLEKLSVLLKRILPESTYERMIRNHYKL